MIPFIDLQAQRERIAQKIDDAVLRVVHSGQFIMGPEVAELEKDLSAFCGAKHAISCSNGTDALALGLRAKGLRRGQAVLVPSFTFAATAEVVAWFDATPIFIDCRLDTMNINPDELEKGLTTARNLGLETVGIIPVDLFGLPADYDAILSFAAANNLWVLADTAQGFGGTYKGRTTGSIGDMASTSFFPAKPLGCYGDGGAFFTDDDELADIVKSIRVHGQGAHKYEHVRIGVTGRLDTIQAAILIEKLKIFPDEIAKRNVIAKRYNDALQNACIVPHVPDGLISTWAQYTIRVTNGRRDEVADKLKGAGIPTAIYYPKPLHRQTAYKHYPAAGGNLPVTDQLCDEVLSLPMHPYLDEETQERIIKELIRALQGMKAL